MKKKTAPRREVAATQRAAEKKTLTVVGIGASAGGLDALMELFGSVDTRIGMAFVVIQHLDPKHESLLAGILSKQTTLSVVEACDRCRLEPNVVHTIPPNQAIRVEDGELRLEPRVEGPGRFMPIDSFFQSLADRYGPHAIGIILSGAGSDGAIGVQEIKAKGGITFAQEESTAKFHSMPAAAISTGVVDFVLSPKEIAAELRRLREHDPSGGSNEAIQRESEDLKTLLSLVQRKTRIDFSQYKFPTVARRVARRMAVHKVSSLKAYLNLVKKDSAEATALSQDILIQVTRFFRDAEAFDVLKEKVYPRLFDKRRNDEPLRIWVPGCATGEEAYSVLISLMEYLEANSISVPIQIFATDLSESVIAKAREARYIENSVTELSLERVRRFFVKIGNTFEINKTLRDLCIFATHNMLSDPPFAKIDLITCRNVLIYLEPPLQKRVLSILHYALKPNGVLLLGNAETTAAAIDYYDPIDPRQHVYAKKPITNRLYFDFAGAQLTADQVSTPHRAGPLSEDFSKGLSVQREIDRVLIAEYVPSGVVVSEPLEVVQFRGKTGLYFEHASGTATLDLLKMLREGLVSPVRSAVEEAKKSKERTRKEGLRIHVDGNTIRLAIEVIPIVAPTTGERFFAILFEPMDDPEYASRRKSRERKASVWTGFDATEEVKGLRAELASTKEYLQALNEEKEAANEELRAANEEVMSSNEELQSTNEELHTAKEELQSTNEELMTVNDELKIRNQELSLLNNDLSNLFTSLNSAVLILTRDLRVRKFTPMAEKILRLIPADIGRKIGDIRLNLEIDNLEDKLSEVIRNVTPAQLEVRGTEGRWYSLQMRPYRTLDDKIDGVLLLLTDINQIKTSLEYAEAVEETIGHPFLVLGGDLKVRRANQQYYDFFHTSKSETENAYFYRLGNGQWDIPKLRSLLEEILPKKSVFSEFVVERRFPQIGEKRLRLSGRRLFQRHKETDTILLSIESTPKA